MKATQMYTWLGLAILCVGLLALLRRLQIEPFLSTGTCPAGFNFFTDSQGQSFCCKGNVKNKQCTAETKYSLCGLAPNLPDPRSGRPLPTCDQLVKDMDPSYKFCPSNIPNYVAPGIGPMSHKNGGCSTRRAEGDGSVFPQGTICLISGATDLEGRTQDDKTFQNAPNGQPSCETLKLQETVQCPANMSVKYDKGQLYVHCMVNNYKYDPKNNVPPFCLTDEIAAMISQNNMPIGLEKAKTNCMSCSYYKKRYIDMDTTAKCVYHR